MNTLLDPSVYVGPVDFDSVSPGEKYWMTSPESTIENPVEEIEIIEDGAPYCQKAFTRVDGLELDGKKIDYTLRHPWKSTNTKNMPWSAQRNCCKRR